MTFLPEVLDSGQKMGLFLQAASLFLSLLHQRLYEIPKHPKHTPLMPTRVTWSSDQAQVNFVSPRLCSSDEGRGPQASAPVILENGITTSKTTQRGTLIS